MEKIIGMLKLADIEMVRLAINILIQNGIVEAELLMLLSNINPKFIYEWNSDDSIEIVERDIIWKMKKKVGIPLLDMMTMTEINRIEYNEDKWKFTLPTGN